MIEVIRFKKNEDALCIFEIEREVFKEKAWSMDMIRSELKHVFSLGFLLLKDYQHIGYLLARNYSDEAEILRIAIKPSYQRRGLGKLLWIYFLKEAQLKGIKKVYLEVSDKNLQAQNFYKKIGFKEIGVRKNYYGVGENAIMLEFKVNGCINNYLA